MNDNVFSSLWSSITNNGTPFNPQCSISELKSLGSCNIHTYRKKFLEILSKSELGPAEQRELFRLSYAHKNLRRMQMITSAKKKKYPMYETLDKFIRKNLCSTTSETSATRFPSVKIASSFPDTILLLLLWAGEVDENNFAKSHVMVSLNLGEKERAINKKAYIDYWTKTVKLTTEMKKVRDEKNTPGVEEIYETSALDKLPVTFLGVTFDLIDKEAVIKILNMMRKEQRKKEGSSSSLRGGEADSPAT